MGEMAFKDDETRRAYFREYNKKWYQHHKDRLLEKRKQHNDELRQWIRQYKGKLQCVECGESHPACLHFHHRNRADKSFVIGSIVGRSHTSFKRVKEEIDKCEVLCGNCHAKFHWRERQAADSMGENYAL